MMEMPQATRKKLETGIAAYKRGMVSYDYVQTALDEFAESCARMAREQERERVLKIVRLWHTLRDASGRLSPVGEEISAAISKG